MKKTILLSDGETVIYDTETGEGYEEVLSFYEPKLITLVKNWTQIPFHDQEDLIQICRIKLLEALNTYDPNKGKFSTYAYTTWNRKIFQISSKYKSKKYSAYIENDTHINLNHKYDKLSGGQYLEKYKDKCPLKKCVITQRTCFGCDYHIRYEKKATEKGRNVGEKKIYTLCKYYKEIINKRGESNKSLDVVINQDKTNLLSFLECGKQKKFQEDEEFRMQFNDLKNHLSPQHFIILQFLLEGYNHSEIIKEMKITNLKLMRSIEKMSNNRKVKELLLDK